jgi:hypothetical protein
MTNNTDNFVRIELKPRDPRALNAYRHGLTGQVLIMTPEDQAAYHQHCQNMKRALAPEGAFEAGLVQSIADDRWRLFRAASLDINTCAVSISEPDKITSEHPQVQTAFAQAVAWAADSKNMNLLSLYEGRIQRRVERNVKMLQEAQAQRKTALQQAVEEAALLAQAAALQGETYDVEREFPPSALPPQFDISLAEIARLAAHQARLAGARKLVPAPRKGLRMAA